MANELETIDLGSLDNVTGGRYTQGPDAIDPNLIQGIGQLAEAVKGLTATKQQSQSEEMNMVMQLAQSGAFGRTA
jgi:hypothetical protein